MTAIVSRRKMKRISAGESQINRELEQGAREFSFLVETSQILTDMLDLDTVLQEIAARIVEAIEPADVCALFVYDPGCDKLVARASCGYRADVLSGVRIAPGEAIVGRAFQLRRAIALSTPEEVASVNADLAAENSELLRQATEGLPEASSAICAPLVYRERAVGSILLENRGQPAQFSQSDTTLIQMLASQIAAEIDNASLRQELQRERKLRRELMEKVISAQEEERKRIARELHDEASQALTALAISLESAQEALPADMVDTKNRLASIRDLILQTLEEIRKLIVDLRPTLLDDLGLIPALRWYVKTRAERSGIRMSFVASGFENRLPSQMETALFRVVQEAVTNITRHSGARTANIRIEARNSGISLTVEDDGSGFDASKVVESLSNGRGLGLLGMKERIHMLDGTLSVWSQPGAGTRIDVEVPIDS